MVVIEVVASDALEPRFKLILEIGRIVKNSSDCNNARIESRKELDSFLSSNRIAIYSIRASLNQAEFHK